MKKNIMIKTAIAGAIVAATTATTIADTTLYGRMRAGVVCTDNGSDTDCALENRSSRFGIKVDQEISDGLTAFGKYEFGVNLDEGALSNGEQTNRLAYVGLKGGFGEVSIGARWSPMYSYVMSPIDPFQLLGGTSGASTYSSTYRRADTVNYKNKFGTTGMHVQLVMDENDAGNDAVDEVQVGAGFKAGPVNLGLAYRDVTDVGSQIGLHAGAKFGMANLGLSLINSSSDTSGVDDELSIMTLAGFGLGGGKAVNVSLHTTDADDEPLIISAEYEHKLSKNYRWFAAVQNADDGNDATDDVLSYGVGMRLEF
ncbi:porin [uncultured Cocleimonas sp.]|uniref:porin n=1 Tax=uncultured Cocleimonas sp. TaxID=1051587 RepID=UPI00260F84E3|nr:porin [uncultured Cocleimonas sp.]